MDRLYIVELSVSAADGADIAVFDTVMGRVRDWLLPPYTAPHPELDLARAGSIDLVTERDDEPLVRSTRWTVDAVGDIRVFQLSMRQPMDGASAGSFATELTVFERGGDVTVRIELGREVVAGLLTPASVKTLRRPGLIGRLLRDEQLACSSQGQPVTGQPQFVSGDLAVVLPEIIRTTSRLPLLLVDGRYPPARGFAHTTAPELAGLVQVVVLTDEQGLDAVAPTLRDSRAELPPNGARLIWPSLDARHPEYLEIQVRRWRFTTGSLLWMAGSVSVPARGQNQLVRALAETKRRIQEEAFEAALVEAASSGNTAAEVETLKARVAELTADNDAILTLAAETEQRSADLEAAKAEAAYYKGEWLRLQRKSSVEAERVWDDAPELDAQSLVELATFLEAASGGAIVFTPNAVRSWKQSGYPHVEQMQEHLVTLAQAAAAWRDADCQIGGMLDDWFQIEWGVAMADTDKGLVHAKADRFTFDGVEYSRVPHLKLDDHTNPSEVGRIYFAHDASGRRFIVDHVGLKLYGL